MKLRSVQKRGSKIINVSFETKLASQLLQKLMQLNGPKDNCRIHLCFTSVDCIMCNSQTLLQYACHSKTV